MLHIIWFLINIYILHFLGSIQRADDLGQNAWEEDLAWQRSVELQIEESNGLLNDKTIFV